MILYLLGNAMAGLIIANVVEMTVGFNLLGWIFGGVMLFIWYIYISDYKFP